MDMGHLFYIRRPFCFAFCYSPYVETCPRGVCFAVGRARASGTEIHARGGVWGSGDEKKNWRFQCTQTVLSTVSWNLNMAIEIVDLAMKHGDLVDHGGSFHRNVVDLVDFLPKW